MAELAFQILSSFIPNWQENKYLLDHFKGSEYNDYLFYLATEVLKRIYQIIPNISCSLDYKELLDEYDQRIRLKK